jgi:hypothetical protein
MIMLPTGTSMTISGLSALVASMAAITTPEPAKMAQKESNSGLPIPLRRRDAVAAAAIVINRRMSTPISKLPCNSRASTTPTKTICTKPLPMDIAASRSTCTANQRHSATTARQSTTAPAA